MVLFFVKGEDGAVSPYLVANGAVLNWLQDALLDAPTAEQLEDLKKQEMLCVLNSLNMRITNAQSLRRRFRSTSRC